MEKKYTVQSKPTDNRYKGEGWKPIDPSKPFVNEGHFEPINAQDSFKLFPKGKFLKAPDGNNVIAWAGGTYPSGHIEEWAPPHQHDAWRDETLPLPLDQADKVLHERMSRNSSNFNYRVKEVK